MRRRSGERVIWVVPETILRDRDGFDFDHVVDVVALDLPRHAGERDQVVGHDDDVVGVGGVGQCETQ